MTEKSKVSKDDRKPSDAKKKGFDINDIDAGLEDIAGGNCTGCNTCSACQYPGCGTCAS